MTNEEAIWTLENGAWWDSLPDDISDADKNPLISAIELAVDALKGHTGEPLTIEQLLGMDGEPVLVVYDEAAKETTPGFEPLTTIALVEVNGNLVFLTNNLGGRDGYAHDDDVRDYGLTVYPYYPTHIDHEAWTAEWIKRDGYTECSKCEHWHDSPENEDDGDRPAFCPSCGRAMKPEAWAMLEKRMT